MSSWLNGPTFTLSNRMGLSNYEMSAGGGDRLGSDYRDHDYPRAKRKKKNKMAEASRKRNRRK